ncbi:DUF4349 domain-containing protein [Mucilaginibacter sp. PAMB04274]|uniref:DUF4349 domain-containing protein n=1 Tax=Mucilaginibacter sp. PAMB04274 TaxID=3138568 RepID=UPI0031F629D6
MSNLLVLLAALCLLGACKGKSNYEPVNNSASSSADTVAADSTTTKLVKTADMDMKVKDVSAASEHIVNLTNKFHGMVMHHQMQSEEVRSQDMLLSSDSLQRVTVLHTTASIAVKIPSDSLEQFMTRVGKLGLHVKARRMDIEDRTLDYLSSQLKLNSRTQLISQQKTGKIKIKDPAAVLMLKDDMVDEKINNKRIDDAARNSVVDMSLYQSDVVMKENIANDDPGAYQISFFKQFTFALANGWQLFASFIIGLTNLWVFILAGVGVWLLVKRYVMKDAVQIKPVKNMQ